MNVYFDSAVPQLLERAQRLCGLIPTNVGRDVAALDVICRQRLEEIGSLLRALRDDPRLQAPAAQKDRLRLFRRARGDLDHIEAVAIAVLCRWNEQDGHLNALADGLAREIAYPLPTPVVSCASRNYYHTFPDLRLVCVPLAEGQFLLHLPDLYHELGHSLFAFQTDSRLDRFQKKHFEALSEALNYNANELHRERGGMSPAAFKAYLVGWASSWQSWLMELFCDLFALYTLGPAFAWAHLHLCASVGSDPYRVPLGATSTHPSDAARMRVLLLGLDRLAFRSEAAEISARWSRLTALMGSRPTPEYQRCFPEKLMVSIETRAFEAVLSTGCNLASSDMRGQGRRLLNEAWGAFWDSSVDYVDWERRTAATLYSVAGRD